MKRFLSRNETLVAITLVVLCLVIGFNNPTFFTVGNAFTLLRGSIVTGIFAMAVLIVIISGGIDVSFTAIGIFMIVYLFHDSINGDFQIKTIFEDWKT